MRSGFIRLAVAASAIILAGSPSGAQIIAEEEAPSPAAPRYGAGVATRYRVGAEITAKGGTVRDIRLMVAVPLECPEQEVHVIEEDISPQIEGVDFRTLPDEKFASPGAKQMLITASTLPPRQEAHALITYEVVTKSVLPPEDPSLLKVPAKPDRSLKIFLSSSPYINVGHRKIRDAVREALATPKKVATEQSTDAAVSTEADPSVSSTVDDVDEGTATDSAYEHVASPGNAEAIEANAGKDEAAAPADSAHTANGADRARGIADVDDATEAASAGANPAERTDWEMVEAIYDYVQDHVKYEAGAQDKSALDTLQEGKADCHGIAALFVAMCRTVDVPARMVWVDGHQYAEFYLEEFSGKGYWFPVQSAGTRAFGEMPTPKVILQKGDNFRVPERRRERLRYASDYTLLLAEPQFKPTVTYVREQL